MSTQSLAEGSERISRAPSLTACIGLVLFIFTMFLFEVLGGTASSDFYMQLQLVLIIAESVLGVVVIAWAGILARRARLLSALIVPSCLALVVLVFTWTIAYPSYRCARDGVALTREIAGFSEALLSYIEEHDGKLPGSLAELVAGRYIVRTEEGIWEVADVGSVQRCVLRNPEWFDVAWGIGAREINDDGMVTGMDRALVRPGRNAGIRGLDEACRAISTTVGQGVATWRVDVKHSTLPQ